MSRQTHRKWVEQVRALGPVAWAESAHGWLGLDGQPVTLADWQRAVLNTWWEHRENVTTLAISNVKKTGKTWTNACLLAWRWLALPGQHYAAGNDLDQSAGRQFSEISDLCKRHSYLSSQVKITRNELVFIPTGSTLTALAVDATGNAGANFLTTSHTETWGILYENGVRAYEELTPPPGRFYGLPTLRIVDSYAGFEGESETWHKLVDRGLAGERIDDEWSIYRQGRMLLFHMDGEEAQARCYRADDDRDAYYDEQRADLRPGTFARLHENKRSKNESQFITPELWAACYDPELRPSPYWPMILGADASTHRDHTSLVGCVWNVAKQRVEVVFVQTWQPVANQFFGGKAVVDLEMTIGAKVLELHQQGRVQRVLYDPYQLHVLALAWARAGVEVCEFPQTSARTAADQALYDAIVSRSVAHYGDPVLNEHVNNAVAIESARGYRLAKEKTSKKIDAAVALSMARHGAAESAQEAQHSQYRSESPGLLMGGARPKSDDGYRSHYPRHHGQVRDKYQERNGMPHLLG